MISFTEHPRVIVFPQEAFGGDVFGEGVNQLGRFSSTLSAMGFNFAAIPSSTDIASALSNCEIFIVFGYSGRVFSDEEIDSVRSFLQKGGSVILVATAPPSDTSELELLNPLALLVGMRFITPRLSVIDTISVTSSFPFLTGIFQLTSYKPLPVDCSPPQRAIAVSDGECILAIDSSLGGFLVATGEDMWFLNGPYIFGGVPCGFNSLDNGLLAVNIIRYITTKNMRFCPIDTDFCEITIDGTSFSLSDESVTWDGFNLCFDPPDAFWTDGNHTINVSARDTCGNSSDGEYFIQFDLSAPVVSVIEPLNDTLSGAGDTVYFHIIDHLSGLDISHSYFVLDNEDTFFLSVRDAEGHRYWLWPWGGWTIGEHRVCLHAQDLSVVCPPNFIDTCFTLVLTEDTLRTYFRDIYVEGCSLVYTEVCVTGGGRFVRDLYLPDFYFYENDSFLIPPWIEQLSTCPGDSLPVDIVFLFDYSTSMDSEVVTFFDAIPSLVSALGVSNYRIACVVFNGCPEEVGWSPGIWKIIRTNFSMTTCTHSDFAPDIWATNYAEFECLYQAVRSVYEGSPWVGRGSGYEDQYGAIYRAHQNLTFRPNALKAFILFTDERPIVNSPPCYPDWDETAEGLDSIIAFCQRNDIVMFPVTPHDGEFAYHTGESPDRRFYDGYYTLGPATGGAWFYLYSSDYDSLAYYIGVAITNLPCCYRFRYWEKQFCNDWNRLRVNVEANEVFYGQDDTIYVPPCPPQPHFIFPNPPGGITTCRSQGASIQFECDGPCAIDWPATIVVAGTHGFSVGTGLLWSEPVLELRPEMIDVRWADGETVRVYLAQCYDTMGCPIPIESTWFVVDTMPPYFFGLFPPHDTVLYIPNPLVRVGIADDVSGVRWEEVMPSNFSIYVNGTLLSGYGVMGDIPYYVLTHPPFEDGDYVTVCVNNVPDDPTYDYCPPNLGDTCWSFRVSISGPLAQLVIPSPGVISACVDQRILIAITDSNGVDSMTILLVINNDTFTVEHPWLKFWNDTLYFEPDSGYWQDGQLVRVRIVRADDIFGAPLQNPFEWQFELDFSPPTADMVFPVPEGPHYEYSPVIQIRLHDNLSGIVPDSFVAHIRYTNGMIDTLLLWQTAMLWLPPDLFISCPQLDIMFPPGDTVYVELRTCDNPTPEYCNPNCADYLWRFYYPFPWRCERIPNPFTPNSDGKNDIVQFTFPYMGEKQGDIFIYDVRNVLVRHIVVPPEGSFAKERARWNGIDSKERYLPEGLYLYVIIVDGRVVCEGTVTIAR